MLHIVKLVSIAKVAVLKSLVLRVMQMPQKIPKAVVQMQNVAKKERKNHTMIILTILKNQENNS
ncbi:MAG: hypothetical protein EBX50_18430 [Chitinophagia bacterium]|nr:hypothetical protein [Chitinophagia bacterium]